MFSQQTRNLPDSWQHDMYEGAGGSGAGGFRSRSNVTSGGSSEGKLIIANLDWGVSDSDISVRNIGKLHLSSS